MNELIQHYDHIKKQLLSTQEQKALEFIKHDCIEDLGNDQYLVKPILGYNRRYYRIEKDDLGYCCNCQGFITNGNCSHVLALLMFLKGLNGTHI